MTVISGRKCCRNETSHTYDEVLAREVYAFVCKLKQAILDYGLPLYPSMVNG